MKNYITTRLILLKFGLIGTFIFCILSCQNKNDAYWISIPGDGGEPNQWLCFRKKLEIRDTCITELAKIAVDSKYWLWINDSLVIRAGGLLRNPNPTDTYFDEFDLAPYLRKGNNIICVLVNYFGRKGGNHNSSGKIGLFFQSPHIISNKDWKVKKHTAFYVLNDEYSNYRYAEQNIGFNANKDFKWTHNAFDDSFWENAVEIGKSPAAPWNNLVKRPIPQFKDYGLSDYIKIERLGDTITAYLPYSAQVNPVFTIRAKKDLKIEIFSDTYSLGSLEHHNSIKTEYLTCNGVQHFEMLHWISGHKILYVIPAEVDVINVQYRETGYNTNFSGNFNCDDQFLNTLWKKCQRTLYVCMRDFYMDCPDRERTQYAGDAANMLNQSFYAFDTNVYAMNRATFERVALWQRSDSTLYMPYGGTVNEDLPLQTLYLTGYHSLYQYFLHTGDTSTIRKIFPAIMKYHKLWKFDRDGLVIQRKDDWYWTDWGENIDERLLENVLYADALKSDVLIARLLGDIKESENFHKQYNVLKSAINKHYWNGNEYRSAGFTGAPDDRGNAIAVLAGIADSSKYKLITDVLTTNLFASTYMERFVLEALFEMDEANVALNRMKKRYNAMVNAEYSTIWEQWIFDKPQNTTATYNHGWSCSPLHLLPQYIAGVKPLEPGFEKYEIVPALTELKKANVAISTLKGQIDVKLSFEGWQYLMEIYSPPSTIARVGIPKKYYHNILKFNGTIVMNTVGRKNRHIENISIVGEDQRYIYVELLPGKWLIEAF